MIYDGGSRTQAAEMSGVTLQVVRDWVLRFNRRAVGIPRGNLSRGYLSQSGASRPMPCSESVNNEWGSVKYFEQGLTG